MGMKLFDDAADVDELEKIEIDLEFAKRYEHNKKREDLQKLEELKKKGYIESGSESDSESDTDQLVAADDLKDFFDGILKIKKKDPILEQKDAKLFKDDDDDDDDDDLGERKKELKKKPMYIKDVNARNLIEEGADFDDELEDGVENKVMSYVEEQNDVRNEVLAAIAAEEKAVEDEDDDDDEGLLREKKRNVEEDEEINEKLDKNDMFLKDFFKNKLWIDNNNKNVGNEDEKEDEKGLSEDEKAIEEQEVYERDYNFRFEESKSDRVLGHSRVVVDSVRKKTNTRKEARERK